MNMKKAMLLLPCMLLTFTPAESLSGNPDSDHSVYGQYKDTYFTRVCQDGNLDRNDPSAINRLPPGFHGNYPDEGIYEIGGHAGDRRENELPPLQVSEGDCLTMVSIMFEQSLLQFPLNQRMMRLGYEVEILKSGGEVFHHQYKERADRLSELFQRKENSDIWRTTGDDAGFEQGLNFAAYAPSHALYLSFWLRKGDKLRYLRFYYGDLPMKVVNASISYMTNPVSQGIESKYHGNDCTSGTFTKRVDSTLVYHMNVQIGKRLSKQFLLSKFLAKDVYDGDEKQIDAIEDPKGYFLHGELAKTGEVFPISLIVKDKQGNESRLRLKLHIVDTEGPSIEMIQTSSISASYQTDLASKEFVGRYFDVSDNSGDPLTYQVLQESGNEIPKLTIGSFPAKLIATDASSNCSELPFSLTLIDDVPPDIQSEAGEINLSPDKAVSSDYLLSLFKARDEIDGDVSLAIEKNTYSANAREIGSYQFAVRCQDHAGNEAHAEMTINVADTEGPVFYAKEKFMTVLEGKIPSLEEIVTSLVRQKVVPDRNYVSCKVIQGEEIGNQLSLGEHRFTLSLVADDESNEEVDLVLNVVKESEIKTFDSAIEEEATPTDPAKMSFWDKVVAWFKNIFRQIADFFRNLFTRKK